MNIGDAEEDEGLSETEPHVMLLPRLRTHLAQRGVELLVPFRQRKHDPWPRLSRDLSRWRSRSDTIFGQLVERTTIKRV